ncbi:MAG: redoxin domain-containing protein [Hymenobacter sp.]|nr:MAG: redoxin domain-containing protein [Hymenobacter sp.]
MKHFLLLVLIALLAGWGLVGQAGPPPAPRQQLPFTVYIFLAETCPISQQATLPLRELHARYAARGVRFVGVFPNGSATAASITDFGRTYAVPFPLQLDAGQQLARRFKATTTPEAVVVAADGRTIRYQGRLDDRYAALGERRSLSQRHELAEALADLAASRPVAVPRTEAVGCFIEK